MHKMNRQTNASAKSKELQPCSQADTNAAHLLLPKRTMTDSKTIMTWKK
jgi:hypothetical protein